MRTVGSWWDAQAWECHGEPVAELPQGPASQDESHSLEPEVAPTHPHSRVVGTANLESEATVSQPRFPFWNVGGILSNRKLRGDGLMPEIPMGRGPGAA